MNEITGPVAAPAPELPPDPFRDLGAHIVINKLEEVQAKLSALSGMMDSAHAKTQALFKEVADLLRTLKRR